MPHQTQRSKEDGWMTKAEVAKEFKVCTLTVQRWMKDGLLPYFKFGHRTLRFKLSDVRAKLDKTSRVEARQV